MEALFRRYFQCKSTGQLQLSRGLNFSVRVGAPKIQSPVCAYLRNNYVYISDNENVMKFHIITRWYARFHTNKSACKFEQFKILNNVKIHISMRYSAWFCTIDNRANRAIRSSLKNRGKVLKNVKYYKKVLICADLSWSAPVLSWYAPEKVIKKYLRGIAPHFLLVYINTQHFLFSWV